MNCTKLFAEWAKDVAKKPAIATVNGSISFEELKKMAGAMQARLRSFGLKANDKVLVMAMPSLELNACVLALLGLGIGVVFVEPWMPLKNIKKVVLESGPKVFLTNIFGMAWGLRVKEIRQIKNWVFISSLKNNASKNEFFIEDVDPFSPGIITFTTGTTGSPKGVLRSQKYLLDQHEVLTKSLHLNDGGADLTIFANFVLSNLARGATSLLMPSTWSEINFKKIDAMADHLKPKSTTCGPAFLLNAMRLCNFTSLDHLHVGGALTDCWIFEEAFKKWPHAEILHVYGSSEAEPVAVVNAKEAVLKSQDRGYFQTLYLGHAVEEAKLDPSADSLWVSGRHVCPKYMGADQENHLHKRIDENGVLWHDMGDRISADTHGLWYQGRSSQKPSDFLLEQQIYNKLKSSKSFIKRNGAHDILWLGENPLGMKGILDQHKEIAHVIKTKIVRDRRHKARIDRVLSTPKKYLL